MKKIGILGGLGPEATADYYKEIINGFNEINKNGDLNYPEIIIYSVNMSKFIGLLEENKYAEATNYLVTCLNNIKNAGAEFAVLSANTPHLLFNEIQAGVNIPLISIVDVCAKKAQEMSLKKCALLGTKFTMQNDFYQKDFRKYNIDIITPNEQQIEFINSKLFTELELGIFKEETKKDLLDIVTMLNQKQSIEAVILGCTEFPLMFNESAYFDIPFLNTTKIHVEAIIKECLKNE